ncbi:MAG: hypothetical protein ACLFMN_08430, partial [Desulfobacterales bacterium]
MNIDNNTIKTMTEELGAGVSSQTEKAAETVVQAKKRGGKVVAVLGSGPNIHEGVTTMVAELIYRGLIDGVSTSSAVIAHEMA